MDDEVEFSGRTVDDAVARAERELEISRDTLDFTVITAGSRGVFGIGAEQARIRVRRPVAVQVETHEVVEVPVAPLPHDVSNDAAVMETSAIADDDFYDESADEVAAYDDEGTRELPAVSDAPVGDLPEEAREVLRELLDVMGFEAEVTVRTTENPIMLAVTGDNLGVLIGRRGDNLAALQFMVNLILSKNRRQWPRVVIDVENYRQRREESLRSLADRIAERVRRNGKAFTLEAMPAGDRRVIHLTLRDVRDVETYSIGEGPARRVVIAPKRISRGETSRASS
ncbi:MAG: hypothetical protein NVSMB22_18950 [Chloroflexota bacterium]